MQNSRGIATIKTTSWASRKRVFYSEWLFFFQALSEWPTNQYSCLAGCAVLQLQLRRRRERWWNECSFLEVELRMNQLSTWSRSATPFVHLTPQIEVIILRHKLSFWSVHFIAHPLASNETGSREYDCVARCSTTKILGQPRIHFYSFKICYIHTSTPVTDRITKTRKAT